MRNRETWLAVSEMNVSLMYLSEFVVLVLVALGLIIHYRVKGAVLVNASEVLFRIDRHVGSSSLLAQCIVFQLVLDTVWLVHVLAAVSRLLHKVFITVLFDDFNFFPGHALKDVLILCNCSLRIVHLLVNGVVDVGVSSRVDDVRVVLELLPIKFIIEST